MCAVLLAAALLPSFADTPSKTEDKRIESLIQLVEHSTAATFIRNGVSYDAQSAARFLRGKWEANGSAIKTAQDFILHFL